MTVQVVEKNVKCLGIGLEISQHSRLLNVAVDMADKFLESGSNCLPPRKRQYKYIIKHKLEDMSHLLVFQ